MSTQKNQNSSTQGASQNKTLAPSYDGATVAEEKSARLAVTVFPIIIIVAFAISFLLPDTFTLLGPGVLPALGIIMFAMGLTLTPPDFVLVVKRPLPILIGVVSQFVIMPLLGLALAWIFGLPPALAAGVILVGCAPGGTSSNVISYLAKGDVALSVTMTAISTLLAPIFTPLLTLWLAGSYLPVPAGDMAMSIVKIVVVPVVAGLLLRVLAHAVVEKVLPVLPWISVAGITYVVMAVVAGSADALVSAGALLLLVVFLHNGLGYVLGYGISKATKCAERASRTTAIEVGMQNSGLAAGLAAQYFSPEAALPAAVFSVWHNISGGLFASLLRRFPIKD
ncbi:MAG: bile acid:sodium symporter family protein [Actinomycetaceae bacterium]|nr:bile acid:sodium symporter family protein [Actinomycetaceae bacterium]